MLNTKLDDTTLAKISEIGDRIAADVVALENLIWLVRAEAIRQLGELSARFVDALAKSQTTPEQIVELHDATVLVMTLDKFWNQEVAMRNRAVQFGQLAERNVPGFQALDTVLKRMPGSDTTGGDGASKAAPTVPPTE